MERNYEIVLVSPTGEIFQERIVADVGENIIDKINKRTPNFHLKSIIEVGDKIPSLEIYSCQGCLEDQPNQLAHMDFPHGCLCQSSSQ